MPSEKEREYQLDRLNAFVKRLAGFFRKRPSTKQELDDLISDLNVRFLFTLNLIHFFSGRRTTPTRIRPITSIIERDRQERSQKDWAQI